MALQVMPGVWADPEREGEVFYDTEIGFPVMLQRVDAQVPRPMIEVMRDHAEECWMCVDAVDRGELITVE